MSNSARQVLCGLGQVLAFSGCSPLPVSFPARLISRASVQCPGGLDTFTDEGKVPVGGLARGLPTANPDLSGPQGRCYIPKLTPASPGLHASPGLRGRAGHLHWARALTTLAPGGGSPVSNFTARGRQAVGTQRHQRQSPARQPGRVCMCVCMCRLKRLLILSQQS